MINQIFSTLPLIFIFMFAFSPYHLTIAATLEDSDDEGWEMVVPQKNSYKIGLHEEEDNWLMAKIEGPKSSLVPSSAQDQKENQPHLFKESPPHLCKEPVSPSLQPSINLSPSPRSSLGMPEQMELAPPSPPSKCDAAVQVSLPPFSLAASGKNLEEEPSSSYTLDTKESSLPNASSDEMPKGSARLKALIETVQQMIDNTYSSSAAAPFPYKLPQT